MFTKTKTALSTAIILGTACIGTAMAKDRIHQRHAPMVRWQVSNTYGSTAYGFVSPGGASGRTPEPAYMALQKVGGTGGN